MSGPEGTINHEKRVQQELGSGIYTRIEGLRRAALERIGIEMSLLKPGVNYVVTLTPEDKRKPLVKIEDRYHLSRMAPTTRLMTITDSAGEGPLFAERFVQPDGSMWQMADSSQGQPWHEATLPVDDLIGTMDRLDGLAGANYEVSVTFEAFRPAGYEPGTVGGLAIVGASA